MSEHTYTQPKFGLVATIYVVGLVLVSVLPRLVAAVLPGSDPSVGGFPREKLVASLASIVFWALASFVVARLPKGYPSRTTNYSSTRSSILAIGGGVLFAVCRLWISRVLGSAAVSELSFVAANGLVVGFAVPVLVAPVVEERYFRGVVYPYLRRKWGVVWAGVTVSVAFTLMHFPVWPDYLTLLGAFGLSMCASLILERTGRLRDCIWFHGASNFVVVMW